MSSGLAPVAQFQNGLSGSRRKLIEDLILESETGELLDGVASANDEPQERNLGSARHDIR